MTENGDKVVSLEYKKQYSDLEPKQLFSQLLAAIEKNGFEIVKKREVAGLIIASKGTDQGKLELTITAGLISRDTVNFLLRGEYRDELKDTLRSLIQTPLS